jgi:regulator of sigma D
MAFRIPNKAKTWFTHISKANGFNLDFDIYYFCLVAGLKNGKKQLLPSNETTEFVQQFVGDYRSHRHLIIASFLSTELKSLGIALTERNALNDILTQLIDPGSATNLSDEGMKYLNQYANQGFTLLLDSIPEPPRTLDGFLVAFYKFVNEA